MKKIIIISSIIIVVAIAVWYFFFNSETVPEETYKFAEVTRGNLSTVISSSGTLEAVSTIEVGTQVSGILSKLLVDFNDNVKRGQLLAILDTTSLAATVRDQKASLNRAEALFNEAKVKHERDKILYEKEFLSEIEYISSKTNMESQLAQLQSAKSSLERAQTNLNYAFIYSPLDGIIINRNIEMGQTVAASFSTPTLFTIAADLSKMRILAAVDESDIGQIKKDQNVKFTVQAYSEKEFNGKVEQVRLEPNTVQNVVNYTVVISADNSEGLLLPGMTATVDFYTEEKENVLLMPSTAVKFKPTQEMMAEFTEEMEKRFKDIPDSIKSRMNRIQNGGSRSGGGMPPPPGMGGGPPGGGFSSTTTSAMITVWFIDANGKLRMSPVTTGSTDGKYTEIVTSMGLEEGTKIIIEAKGTKLSSDNFPRMNLGFGS
ncbi:MAG: efflux RND transporter periplasmic adaptor subunit [bacterium]